MKIILRKTIRRISCRLNESIRKDPYSKDIDEELVEKKRFARKYDPSIQEKIYDTTTRGYVFRELNRETDQTSYLNTNEVQIIVKIVNMKKKKSREERYESTNFDDRSESGVIANELKEIDNSSKNEIIKSLTKYSI